MRILGKEMHLSFGKLVLWLIGLSFLALVGWFFYRTAVYYRAIRNGDSNPILNEQLQMSVSRAIETTNRAQQVDPEYGRRLVMPDAPTLGPADAPLMIVEFLDFDCPYCKAAFPSVRELQARFGTQVRLIVRYFPLRDLHPHAQIAAQAGACANKFGHFWPYHDKLFTNQDKRTEAQLVQFATESGMDGNLFATCLNSQDTKDLVERDFNDGIRAGAVGTPTFFFNGTKIPGWGDSDGMAFLIQTWLNQLQAQKPKTP